MTSSRVDRDSAGGLIRVAVAGVIWGTIPLVIRAADGSSPVKVFYRVAFAALATLLWMALTGRLREFRGLTRRKLLAVISQGVVLTVNWLLFLGALDMTKVAVAELLGYTGPVFVAAFAPLVTREAFDRRIVLPLALALGGIAVIMFRQGISLSSSREVLGALMAFGSALTYAVLMLRSKVILRDISSGALMVVEYGTATLLLLPALILLPGPSTAVAFGSLATLGLVQTAFAGLVFLSGLRRVRTDHAAILTYAEPVSAVLFAALLLSEPLTVSTLIGGAMVVTGGVIVARLRPAFGLEAPTPAEVKDIDLG